MNSEVSGSRRRFVRSHFPFQLGTCLSLSVQSAFTESGGNTPTPVICQSDLAAFTDREGTSQRQTKRERGRGEEVERRDNE